MVLGSKPDGLTIVLPDLINSIIENLSNNSIN